MPIDYISRFKCPYELTDRDFLGINFLTGERVGQIAFSGDPRIESGRRAQQGLEQNHSVCQTTSELTKIQELNLDAEGSKDSLKLSAGLRLLTERSVSSTSVVCVSHGSLIAGSDEYARDGVSLSDDARSVLTRDPEKFLQKFGTHFIGGYIVGALFDSYIEYKTTSLSKKQEVFATLSGSYQETVTASGSAGFSDKEEHLSRISNASGRLTAVGYAESIDIMSVDSVSAAFKDFSIKGQENPGRITCICVPYTEIQEVNDIMRESHQGAGLLPNIPLDRVHEICREYRECIRAKAAMEEYDNIAALRHDLHDVSNRHYSQLLQHADSLKSLDLFTLDRVNPLTGATTAQDIYRDWQKEFKETYDRLPP